MKSVTFALLAAAIMAATAIASAADDAAGIKPRLSSGGGELVLNGGFDEVVDGKTAHWNTVGKKFTYRDGEGRNGTRALCYENDDPKFYSFPGQKIQLKAGHAYEYQVWVKTEDLTGNESGATVCFEWNDANGKWLGGAYVGGVNGHERLDVREGRDGQGAEGGCVRKGESIRAEGDEGQGVV